MRKLTMALIALLVFPGFVAAGDLREQKNFYDEKLAAIEKEIQETDDKTTLIALSREESELAAYQRAYEKAIEHVYGSAQTMMVSQMYIVDHASELPYIQLYKSAAQQYNIDWALLAAIHDVETSFSTHPTMVSYAGAQGHMQFMPGTWAYYGVDADGDGKADPYSLPDAVYAAANYLAASGADRGKVTQALFAYNRSTQYGLDVMAKADKYRQIGGAY